MSFESEKKSSTEKQKHVGIIEIYPGHHVFVHTLGSILLRSGYKVTVFTTESIYSDLVFLYEDQS